MLIVAIQCVFDTDVESVEFIVEKWTRLLFFDVESTEEKKERKKIESAIELDVPFELKYA